MSNNIKLIKHTPYVMALFIICFSLNTAASQVDSARLQQLIKEVNETFLLSSAQAVALSPSEYLQYNRDQTIKNIEMVDAFEMFRTFSNKQDTIPFIVENNQTIVQKPEERFNSITYLYHLDGRIDRTFRGSHLNDLFLTDEEGFLIQHGYGGELKRAKREGNTLEWYNVQRNRLEYITAFDEEGRPAYLKTMGHFFGPAVDYEMEEYSWRGDQLTAQNTIKQYKEGGADSTFVRFEYDSLGVIQTISNRNEGEVRWSSTTYTNKIDYLDGDTIKITLSYKDDPFLSITFDHYDNWVEMLKYNNIYRKDIKYRQKRRIK